MLGLTAMGRSWRLQTAIGGALLGVAGVFGVVSLAAHDHGILLGAAGPSLAGAINLGFGLAFRRKAKEGAPAVILSDEAAALLRALVARAQVWQGGWGARHPAAHRPHAWTGYQAPVPPPASAMDALERAAAAHRRVTDALGEAKDERAARLRSAADAGMGEALHQAAVQTQDPRAIEATVARLEELADLVQAAVGQPDSVSVLRSNLESTIEELKAEAEAVRELRS